MPVRLKSLCLALVLTFIFTAVAAAAPQRHKLPSGLTVITSENHEAQVVSFQVWVRAGSAFEEPAQAGITHLIEHMIFKGTPKDPNGEMAGRIEGLGGSINAYTTFDHTNYYVTAGSQFGAQALELLADAVVNAQFDPTELAREKEVVIEEIRMGEDNPDRRLSKAVFRQAFGADHPYGRPIIGFRKNVRAITRADILDYRKKWYRAPNMVVVAVGDFKTKELMPRLKKAFAGLPTGPAPKFELPPVKTPPGPRLLVMREKVRQAQLVMTWLIPGLPHESVYAMDLAATVAGGGETSRLYAGLKEKLGLVDDADASAFTPQGVGLFEVSATLAPGGMNKAWQPLLKEALTLISQPASAQELKRSRVSLSAGFIHSRETMQGQARVLGYFEMMRGGFEKVDDYIEKFRSIGAGQVSDASRKYLTSKGLSVVIQIPEGAPAPSQEELAAAAAKLVQAARVQVTQEQKTSYAKLPSGLTLIVKPAHSVPLVSMVLTAAGGQILEDAKTAGLYSLWSQSITRGSQGSSYQELITELESMAGDISAFSGKSTLGLSGSFLSGDWRRGLELFSEVWLSPSFLPGQVQKAKAEQLADLRAQQNSPVSRAFLAFRGLIYGKHPFAHNPLGSPESLKNLGPAALKAAHAKVRGPGRTVLVVVGDVDPLQVRAQVEKLWAGAKGQAPAIPQQDFSGPQAELKTQLEDPQAKQTQIVLGFTAPSSRDPRRFAAEVLNAILGGFGGPLFSDLRDKRSLAYAVQPFFFTSPQGGVFGVYMGAGAGKEPQALAGLNEHLSAARTKAPAKEALERAKAYILGGVAIGLQTYSSQASVMAGYELLGLGWDYQAEMEKNIAAVSAGDVLEVAKKIIRPQDSALVTLGP